MPYQEKVTEFNMSLATLIRIDKLLRQANACSQGLFSLMCKIPLNDNVFYLKALDGIFMEAQTKMSDDEKKKCDQFRNKIMELKIKWRKDINIPTKMKSGMEISNQDYFKAWKEIKYLAREYNIYLMNVMDGHNMLLKNKDLTQEDIY